MGWGLTAVTRDLSEERDNELRARYRRFAPQENLAEAKHDSRSDSSASSIFQKLYPNELEKSARNAASGVAREGQAPFLLTSEELRFLHFLLTGSADPNVAASPEVLALCHPELATYYSHAGAMERLAKLTNINLPPSPGAERMREDTFRHVCDIAGITTAKGRDLYSSDIKTTESACLPKAIEARLPKALEYLLRLQRGAHRQELGLGWNVDEFDQLLPSGAPATTRAMAEALTKPPSYKYENRVATLADIAASRLVVRRQLHAQDALLGRVHDAHIAALRRYLDITDGRQYCLLPGVYKAVLDFARLDTSYSSDFTAGGLLGIDQQTENQLARGTVNFVIASPGVYRALAQGPRDVLKQLQAIHEIPRHGGELKSYVRADWVPTAIEHLRRIHGVDQDPQWQQNEAEQHPIVVDARAVQATRHVIARRNSIESAAQSVTKQIVDELRSSLMLRLCWNLTPFVTAMLPSELSASSDDHKPNSEKPDQLLRAFTAPLPWRSEIENGIRYKGVASALSRPSESSALSRPSKLTELARFIYQTAETYQREYAASPTAMRVQPLIDEMTRQALIDSLNAAARATAARARPPQATHSPPDNREDKGPAPKPADAGKQKPSSASSGASF